MSETVSADEERKVSEASLVKFFERGRGSLFNLHGLEDPCAPAELKDTLVTVKAHIFSNKNQRRV